MEVQRGLYHSRSNPHLYAGVPQHAYAITTANSSRPILFTCHVVSCIAVTLYDVKSKIGALLHIDVDTTNTVRKVFEKLKNQGVKLNELEVHMIGGLCTGDEEEEDSRELCSALKEEILLKTSHVKEKLFQNVLMSSKDEDRYFELIEIMDGTCKEREEEINQILEQWKRSLYTQIALDALSGEVYISSEIDHFCSNPLANETYSIRAREWKKKLDLICCSDNIESIASIPLAKVYDATKNKNYYSL